MQLTPPDIEMTDGGKIKITHKLSGITLYYRINTSDNW
jgi:hypothetical protein